MKRRLFVFFLGLLFLVPLSAQYELSVDGELLAHDVARTGAMPPALRELIGRRHLQETPSAMRPFLVGLRTSRHLRQMRSTRASSSITPVAPLLKSVRDQEEPYNLLCPYWQYDDGTLSENRCLSGCVATCIEQIMAYYHYPEVLLDTLHGWSTDHYEIADLLPGTRFDWDNYLLDYRNGWTEAQGQAIALVSLACGMAVHMSYGPSSSGANTYRAVGPLRGAFGYGMADYVERISYTPDQWHALIQYELQNSRPVAYCGHNMELHGHAFNIDGVDAQGFYHVNWGYNGAYDGWYDLDWLNPWETDDLDPNGIAEGMFCNQSMLLMHPSKDAKPLEVDTLDIKDLGVELLDVNFQRPPDLQGFVPADFHFRNSSNQAVTYTFEVMTNLPTDTALFEQADYVGLSGVTIPANAELTHRVYLQFMEQGERILGISHDDETIPFTMPVNIVKGTRPVLEWGRAEVEVTPTSNGEFAATFTVPVTNNATSGYAGSLVTLCLYPEGDSNEDVRHWWVLSLAGGESEQKSVTFSHLKPETYYHFLLRCPWQVQASADFWTTVPLGIDNTKSPGGEGQSFDLSGRPAPKDRKGIVIKNGKKWMQR